MNAFVWKLGIRFFAARKGRTFFSILGISLGILLVTAVQIVFTSLNQSYDAMQRQKYGNYDVLAYFQTDGQGLTNQELDQLKDIQGVEALQPILYPYQNRLPRYFSDSLYDVGLTDSYLSRQLKNYDIAQGRFPLPHEVALSPGIMSRHHLHIGSAIQLSFPHRGLVNLTVSGELSSDSQKNFGIAVYDYAWLQKITGIKQATGIVMKLRPNLSENRRSLALNTFTNTLYRWAHRMGRTITIYTKGQLGALGNATNYIAAFLPLLKGLSVTSIVASIYIVISTLQISLQERRKEYALLRLLGVNGRQLTGLVLIESLLYSVLSTLAGLALGIGLSLVIKTISVQMFHVQMIDLIISWQPLGWIALSGIAVMSAAGLIPARQVRCLSPIEAYRSAEPSDDQEDDLVSAIVAPSLILLSLLLVVLTHILRFHPVLYVVGGLGFVVGVYVWIPSLLQGSAWLSSKFLRHLFGSQILMASRNIVRHRSKSALCVGALMLTILIANAGILLLHAAEAAETAVVSSNFPHDITLNSLGGFSPALATQVGRLKGIDYEEFTTGAFAQVINAPRKNSGINFYSAIRSLQGTDLQTDKRIDHFRVVAGNIDSRRLAHNGVVLTASAANVLGFKVGDNVSFKNPLTGRTTNLQVAGIIKGTTIPFGAPFLYTSPAVMARDFSVRDLQNIQINVTTGNTGEVLQTLRGLLRNPQYQNVELINKLNEKQKAQEAVLLFGIVLGITILTITVIAAIVLMNHTASAVRMRFRELATLRAIGMTKGRLIRLILAEGMMISTLGGLAGTVAGGALAYLALMAVGHPSGVWLLIPTLCGSVLLSPLLGLLASWSAAAWAARQEIIGVLSDQ